MIVSKKRPQTATRIKKNLSFNISYRDKRNSSRNNNNQSKQNITNNNITTRNHIKQKSNTKTKSSMQKVLSTILDPKRKFNIYSPSQLKQINDEIKINQHQNLKSYSLVNDDEKNSYLISSLSICLLDIEKNNEKFSYMDINSKVSYIIHFITHENIKIRLGAVILEYILFKKYSDLIDENIKIEILKNILINLHETYETQEELFLVCCINFLSLYNSSYKFLINSISLIAMFLTDFNYPYLQRAAFVCLMNLGYIGIQTLINIASKDIYQDYQKYILSSLIKTPHIQKLIIAKALVKELKANEFSKRIEALSALNRLYDIIDSEFELLKEIADKLDNEKFKNYKLYLASVLRCSGINGLHLLIEKLETCDNPKTREIICTVLGYKLLKKPPYIEIVLDNNDLKSNNIIEIGKFCKYFGEVSPVLSEKNVYKDYMEENDLDTIEFVNEKNNNKISSNISKNEFLLVSTRDFLSGLQKLMNYDLNHENAQIVYNGEKLNLLDDLDISLFLNNSKNNNKYIKPTSQIINENILIKYKEMLCDNNEFILNNNNEDNNLYLPVNKNVIKYLSYHLNDYDDKVRLASAISLGQISLPEGAECVKDLSKVINIEKNIEVLPAMLWALGRNLEPSMIEYIPLILKNLKSNIWKIKLSSIFALTKFGRIAAEQAVPILSKLLLESSINKTKIAEAMISMGDLGEKKLLELIDKNKNYGNTLIDKLICSIIKAFAYINMNSRNLDFVVQFLCNQLNNNSANIRKNVLYCLRKLSNRLTKNNPKISYNEDTGQNYIYLTEKNIIPIFYDKLKDKDLEIQKYAIDCILEFGPKGELIFIEGLIKDKSPTVRCNCAIGLCLCGVHTLRTLINKGLYDCNANVRKNIQEAILHFFNVNDIIEYYIEKNQLFSLKISVEEYLAKGEDISIDFFKFAEYLISKIISSLEK